MKEKQPLAIAGGRPVRAAFLPYARQTVDEEDIRGVVDALRSDWLTTGPVVERYEAAFAEAVGARHAVALSSGTAALHAAVFAAGLGPGDEAITSPLTFAATANAVLYQGARPVFADVEPDTLTIDPAAVAACVTPRTRAVLPVDYAGHPADYDALRALAARHGLAIIADACHALGATRRGVPVGRLADLTVFSTHPAKHVTTGEGGIVVTDDADAARRLRLFRNHGITTETRERLGQSAYAYEMVALGYNYRITDVQCALGLSQLAKRGPWLARRRAIATRYAEAFRNLKEIQPLAVREAVEPAWHIYVIRLALDRLAVDRDAVFQALRAEGIGVNVHYIPVPWHPYYEGLGYRRGAWPVAEGAFPRLLTLPLFPGMTDADVGDVVAAVSKVLEAYRR